MNTSTNAANAANAMGPGTQPNNQDVSKPGPPSDVTGNVSHVGNIGHNEARIVAGVQGEQVNIDQSKHTHIHMGKKKRRAPIVKRSKFIYV